MNGIDLGESVSQQSIDSAIENEKHTLNLRRTIQLLKVQLQCVIQQQKA